MPTPSSAKPWPTITAPTTAMTQAVTSGASFATRSKRGRETSQAALRTTAIPSTVSTAASPRLNATISTRP